MIPRSYTVIEPSWVTPRIGQTVLGIQADKKGLIRVTYDFINGRWINMKGEPIKIQSWLRK
jgi:hypothetical protein